MNSPKYSIRFLLPILVLLLAGSCDESDSVFIDQIGTVKLQPTSPSLGQQTIKDASLSMQTAAWNFTRATLTVNDMPIDLLVGSKCLIVDTAAIPFPSSQQKCQNGIVVDSIDDVIEATVDIAFTLKFSRAEPVDLPQRDDFDGDGWINGLDNCPLVFNPRQPIESCSSVSGIFLSDSDADLIDDFRDNCIWIPNSDQANTKGLAAIGFPDLIGDACEEQRADAELNGSREFVISGIPIDYTQPLNQLTYIVVEVDHKDGVNCDFDSGVCTVDDGAVKVCQQFVLSSALDGCP